MAKVKFLVGGQVKEFPDRVAELLIKAKKCVPYEESAAAAPVVAAETASPVNSSAVEQSAPAEAQPVAAAEIFPQVAPPSLLDNEEVVRPKRQYRRRNMTAEDTE
jgi:hypothetical protein